MKYHALTIFTNIHHRNVVDHHIERGEVVPTYISKLLKVSRFHYEFEASASESLVLSKTGADPDELDW